MEVHRLVDEHLEATTHAPPHAAHTAHASPPSSPRTHLAAAPSDTAPLTDTTRTRPRGARGARHAQNARGASRSARPPSRTTSPPIRTSGSDDDVVLSPWSTPYDNVSLSPGERTPDPLSVVDRAYPVSGRPSVSTWDDSRKISYADASASSLHLGLPPDVAPPDDAPADDTPSGPTWAARQQRPSHGATREVQLTDGHWIVDYPVPTPIANAVEPHYRAQGAPREFTHVRYSAVTCDPDDFVPDHGWGLRTSSEYERETELLITLTYYNEDRSLLTRTLHSVMQNIRDLCHHRSSAYWGQFQHTPQPAWQRIVVALVFDGIDPCDKQTLDVLATIGVYQDGLMKREVNGQETVAHLFEYTTQVSVDPSPRLVQPVSGDAHNLVPVQMIFCFKQKNAKKINSHRWVFHALGRMLRPELVVLIDVGTKPGPLSIYHLWEAFHNNPHLGGACGEIHAMIRHGTKLLNPLVAAQNFEYKISNILDKPMESALGYVSVLPGAFSAYRYAAVVGRPLEQYFHGDHTLAARLGSKGIAHMNIFKKNMFLAEDRILCFELVAKAGDKWTLAYVKPSKAETDVPERTAELISQRRRWLNGSFAASVYSLVHFGRLYRSRHGFVRMFFFHLQALFNLAQLVLSWLALANLWLTFAIIIQYLPSILLRSYSTAWLIGFHYVNLVLMWLYAFFLALQFVLALGNRPKSEHHVYALSFAVFGFLGVYTLAISMWLTVHTLQNLAAKAQGDYASIVLSDTTVVLIASLAAMFGVYLIASIMYADPWHMLTSSVQYTLLAPSFVNVMNVYAFCNLHDVSWGTKGSDKADALPSVGPAQSAAQPDTFKEVALGQAELDGRFKDVVARAMAPHSTQSENAPPTMEDGNRTFRTRLVALWLLSNAFLVALIMNLYDYQPQQTLDEEVQQGRDNQQIYFKVILWSTFGMAFIRFLGSSVFWLQRQTTRWSRHT